MEVILKSIFTKILHRPDSREFTGLIPDLYRIEYMAMEVRTVLPVLKNKPNPLILQGHI